MKVLITGASGLVGTRLIEALLKTGKYEVSVLTRNPASFMANNELPISAYKWDLSSNYIDTNAFENVEAVIHLAGENVAGGRWTQERKRNIFESRSNGTKILIDEIRKHSSVKTFISSSAIGIYGNSGEKLIDETYSGSGESFLEKVCLSWEEEALNHGMTTLRSIALRTGIVLANEGGALLKMLPPFKAGVGGILGNGKQYMSWIHIDDLVSMFIHGLENQNMAGAYNAVAPNAVTNKEFTKTLGKVLKRPTIFPVPGFVLKIIFGEMSEILLEGQNVSTQKIEQAGFEFSYRDLENALMNILNFELNGELIIKRFQFVPKAKSEVFEFFSNEKNLEVITPEHLNFKVIGKSTPKIEDNTLIDYKLSLYGLPLKWQSRIENWNEGESFEDIQVKGPYKKWHHAHRFYKVPNGTLMEDYIIYKLRGGILGKILTGPFVKHDLNKIFNYRFYKINQLF